MRQLTLFDDEPALNSVGSSVKQNTTPAPKGWFYNQYLEIKRQYPDAILLFRHGDFYEAYGEDAEVAYKILDITLTHGLRLGRDITMCGFPFHSLDTYLPKLVRAGKRVAICDELTPRQTKQLNNKIH